MSGGLHTHKVSAATTFLALLAVFVLLGILALAPPVRAATGGAAGPEQSVGNIVEVDQAVTVPSGTTADNVFVVGGGTLTSAPGATIVGDTTYEPLSAVRDVFSSGFWEPIATPFTGMSLIGWAGSTVILVLLGLLIAAVLPRQTRAPEQRIAGHFWSSLGWGALTALVIVPLITLALVVTIIGILVAIPWVFAAVAVFLFGYLAFGAFFGRPLLRLVGYRGESLMLPVTVGVIASQLVRLIPYIGAPIVSLMWMIGGGAAIAAFFAWRRSNKQMRAVPSEEAESGEPTLRAA